jgi:hypothetical protein
MWCATLGYPLPAAFVSLSIYLRFSFAVGKISSLLSVEPITVFLGHFAASAFCTDEFTLIAIAFLGPGSTTAVKSSGNSLAFIAVTARG